MSERRIIQIVADEVQGLSHCLTDDGKVWEYRLNDGKPFWGEILLPFRPTPTPRSAE